MSRCKIMLALSKKFYYYTYIDNEHGAAKMQTKIHYSNGCRTGKEVLLMTGNVRGYSLDKFSEYAPVARCACCEKKAQADMAETLPAFDLEADESADWKQQDAMMMAKSASWFNRKR